MDIFEKVNKELSGDIERINNLIVENIQVPENLVNDITNYVLKRKGKKIRPIVTLLTTKMIQNHINDESIYLAASVELIHIATLLHDDVIDFGTIRNGQISPNQIWNNKTTILAGDFLFSQAFKFMVKAKNLSALDLLSSSSAIISEGEMSQLRLQKEQRIIDRSEYFDVIERKTAQLFASASACGAIACSSNRAIILEMKKFGFLFGKIFQISDDVLDYTGSKQEIGKNIGSDFFQSKVTLPVIIAYDKCNIEEKNFWEVRFFENGKTEKDLEYAIELIDKYNIADEIFDIMQDIKREAIESVTNFDNNMYKKLLLELLEFCMTRRK